MKNSPEASPDQDPAVDATYIGGEAHTRPNGAADHWPEPEPPDDFGDLDDKTLRRMADEAADRELDEFVQALDDFHGCFSKADEGGPSRADAREVLRHLHELNRRYFVARQGVRAYVFEERPGGVPTPMGVSDFGLLLASRKGLSWKGPKGGHHRINISKLWSTWNGRREHGRVVFDPSGRADPDDYNLWSGFAVKPSKEGSCERFKHHLLEHVCGGNDEHYRYLWRWMAHGVQHPELLPKVAVVLIGPQGAGKSTLGEVLGWLFGPHYIALAGPDDLLGRFNIHLRNKVLILANEVVWRGSKVAEAQLKAMVTEPRRNYEPKGIDKFSDPNFSKIIITSNERHVVPVAADDRRFFVRDVKHTYETDDPRRLAYFAELYGELEDGGYERLLWELLDEPLDGFNPEARPETEALAEQKMHSLEPHAAWWLGLLEQGELPSEHYPDEWGLVQGKELHKDYLNHCHANRVRPADRCPERALLARVRELLPAPGWSKEKPYVDVRRGSTTRRKEIRHLKLPPLEECRRAWNERMRTAHDWEEL